MGFVEKRESGEGTGKPVSDRQAGVKALKGEARERWGLKEASKGLGTVRR
jgi:hypothetical protein